MGSVWQRVSEAMHPSAPEAVNQTGTDEGLETPPFTNSERQEETVSEGRLSIAKDFSPLPGGADSAREFLKQLGPMMEDNDQVVIDLDGVVALPASFLRHIFHALVTEHGVAPTELPERVKLETTDPELKIYVAMAKKYASAEAELATA